jgi:hypothetical protein
MSREERLSKVRSCAQRLLRPPEVEQLITMVEELEALRDLRQLMARVAPQSAA